MKGIKEEFEMDIMNCIYNYPETDITSLNANSIEEVELITSIQHLIYEAKSLRKAIGAIDYVTKMIKQHNDKKTKPVRFSK